MKLTKPSELSPLGLFILIYSSTGVGKSYNSVKTLAKPLLWITAEPRSYDLILKPLGLSDKDVTLASYNGLEDLLEFLATFSNFDDYKSVLFDSLTYFMDMDMTSEITEENWESKSEAEKKSEKKPLKTRLKLSLPGRGDVNRAVMRVLELLGKIAAKANKTVVVTALEQDNPKYARGDFGMGPSLSGREVPQKAPGLFDLIGYAEHHYDKNGKLTYPPQISFHPFGNFLCKATGDMPQKIYPLDFGKILNIK